MSRVRVEIVDGPVSSAEPADDAGVASGVGATLEFEGIVRGTEDGRPIEGLDYAAYEPMATRQLLALAEDVLHRHGLLGVRVAHSRGRVPVGRCSFRLSIWSRHRKEGLAAADEFIDRLKRDVPIWKSAVWSAERSRATAAGA